MNRRNTIKYLAAGSVVTAIGGSHVRLSREREHAHLSIESVLGRLDSLDPNTVNSSASWEVARTFNHLAQSVEFSMTGFPDMKPKLFRNTLGKLAFSVFQANGRMTHGLDEVIPGEIVDIENNNAIQAHQRLIDSLNKFDAHTADFQPHFAYGQLSKTQYMLAHVMHVNNHLEEFGVRA